MYNSYNSLYLIYTTGPFLKKLNDSLKALPSGAYYNDRVSVYQHLCTIWHVLPQTILGTSALLCIRDFNSETRESEWNRLSDHLWLTITNLSLSASPLTIAYCQALTNKSFCQYFTRAFIFDNDDINSITRLSNIASHVTLIVRAPICYANDSRFIA